MVTKKIKNEIEDLKLQIEAKAAERWNKRKQFRDNPAAFLETNPVEKSQMETRYKNYNIRESARIRRSLIKAVNVNAGTPERKIGDTLDLNKRPPSDEAYQFGKPVGRIYQIPDDGLEIDAFGTGFMISPNLLMTNHHVLPFKDYAEACAVNFQYEYNEFNKLQSGTKFKLNPNIFFYNDEKLDFAIVYVEPLDMLSKSQLSLLGFHSLIATKGKVILNEPINIVQYPQGGPKQYATENNLVKDILEEEGFIQYSTDTLEASSGSPAANKYWEVAALHHSGIAMVVDGQVWSRFNKPFDNATMTDSDKYYIANEGVSISRIIEFLKTVSFPNQKEADLIKTVLNNSIDTIIDSTSSPQNVESKNQLMLPIINPPIMGQNVFNFHNTSNVNIYTTGGASQSEGIKITTDAAIITPEKKLRFDESYSNRRYKGYKPKFLGMSIDLPTVAPQRLSEIFMKEGSDNPLILKYYHYSLVMNKKFKLQMFSAVNVDYDPSLKSHRDRTEFGDEGNSWRSDPRIPEEIQLTDPEFYKPATKVDRGHVVRRDDSCYGNTELEIEFANSDTFHWTNCTPQHEGFNQSMQWGLWGLLENAIKEGLSGDDTKASIFAGPILVEDENRVFNGFYYPIKFWKVIATSDETEGLLAYGFILDQSGVIDKKGLETKFDFTRFKNQQVSLLTIEQESGIVFPDILKDADIFVKNGLDSASRIDLESKSSVLINVTK